MFFGGNKHNVLKTVGLAIEDANMGNRHKDVVIFPGEFHVEANHEQSRDCCWVPIRL